MMERLLRSLLIFFAAFCAATVVASSPTERTGTGSSNFIRSSCSATHYPAVCLQSLSAYATAIKQSPKQLAKTALTVSLSRARSASAFVSNLSHGKGMRARDRAAIKDCVDNIGDSVEELARSVRELGGTSRSSFTWQMSNVETWVSAALTDENTCVDGFVSKGKVRDAVRARIVNVAQVTSNALALVNRYAANP